MKTFHNEMYKDILIKSRYSAIAFLGDKFKWAQKLMQVLSFLVSFSGWLYLFLFLFFRIL